VKTAKQHDAQPLYLLHTVPGIRKMRSRGWLDAMPQLDRFPSGQPFVSYGRLGKCRQASGGKRLGTSGTNIGKAHLKWAVSAAAPLCLRNNAAGQTSLARLEHKHGNGKALTLLAHPLGRAVYAMRQRQTALGLDRCLRPSRRRAGASQVSLDPHGMRLARACSPPGGEASLHAKARLGRCSLRLVPGGDTRAGAGRRGAGRPRCRGLPLPRA
jgi:hypothetical protein